MKKPSPTLLAKVYRAFGLAAVFRLAGRRWELFDEGRGEILGSGKTPQQAWLNSSGPLRLRVNLADGATAIERSGDGGLKT